MGKEKGMPRRVSMSEQLAHTLFQLRQRAIELGLRDEFRIAWRKIWDGLNSRPLPPDESPDTFGDLHFTTRHPPRHRICIACVLPLSVRFAVCDDGNAESGEIVQTVTILRVDPMFE
jgi:hypothetical protein